jgi:hypothetical protein
MSYLTALMAELHIQGATDVVVDPSHPHPRVCFTWNGAKRFYVTGATPSDRRGLCNALTSLRRFLGVRRVVRKSLAPRRRKRCGDSVPKPPETFTIAPDPWRVLQERRASHG